MQSLLVDIRWQQPRKQPVSLGTGFEQSGFGLAIEQLSQQLIWQPLPPPSKMMTSFVNNL